MNRRRRRFLLFSIYGHFPKLNVASSILVSRSNFSWAADPIDAILLDDGRKTPKALLRRGMPTQ
jgi:hypothetical protein